MAQNPPPAELTGISFTTPVNDFLLYERVEAAKYEQGKEAPEVGSAHAKASQYPDFVLCRIVDDSQPGWLRMYYAKTRAAQEGYNWELGYDLRSEWPELRATFVDLREGWTAEEPVAEPNDFGGERVWTWMGVEQRRSEDPITDGLFVVAIHTYRDIREALIGQRVDMETGTLRTQERTMVPAGTDGAAIDEDGLFSEVQPINTIWAIQTTERAAGLAGGFPDGAGGFTHTRTYEILIEYSWPPVLDYPYIAALPGPGSRSIAGVFFTSVLLREEYTGPCKATVIEAWSKEAPTVTPNAPMLARPIEFRGGLLNVSIAPTLHSTVAIWEGTGSGNRQYGPYQITWLYPATPLTDWPEAYMASVSVTPSAGGYLMRTILVERPATTTAANQIRARVTEVGATTITLVWTTTIAGAANYLLDVSTDATFEFGLVSGYNGKVLGNVLTTVVTGLTRGQVYYLRLRNTATLSTSNTVVAMARPMPEIQVEQPENTALTDGASTIDFGSVSTISTGVKTFVIRNVGLLTLSDLAVSIDGTHAAEYTAAALEATTLAAGATMELTVTFDPSTSGVRTAALHIASDDGNENPFDINLTGTGVKAEIQVEQPAATVLTTGVSSKAFGSVNTGATSSLTFTIKNIGDGTLSSISASILGVDAAQFSITGAPAAALAPLASTTCIVQFAPTADGAAVASLSIANDDEDENPFVIGLTGTGVGAPEIGVEGPVGETLTDGSGTVSFGTIAPGGGGNVQTFTIRNSGVANLTGLVVTKGGTHSADLTVSALGSTTVTPGSSTTFTVTWVPAAVGTRTATLAIASNDADENPFDIALTCLGGIAQEISVEQPAATILSDAGSVAWGGVFSGASLLKTFVIRNIGNLNLTGLSAAVTSGNSADWTVGALPASSLAPGASMTFDVTFSPGGNAGRTTLLQIQSNDTDESVFDLTLTGSGVPVPGLLTFQEATNVLGQTTVTGGIGGVTDTLIQNSGGGLAISAGGKLAFADRANNRVLIWNTIPTTTGVAADVVVGQALFTTNATGLTAATMNAPQGVAFNAAGTKLIVADSGNHRVLIFNTVPTTNGASANVVLGQTGFGVGTSGSTSQKYTNPTRVYVSAADRLYISDTGNNRVLQFTNVPTVTNTAAPVAIGQPDLTTVTTGNTAAKMNAPGEVAVTGTKVLVADAGNNRVIIFATIPVASNASATVVVGQTGFGLAAAATTQTGMSGPTGVAVSLASAVAVADTLNNRVLIYYAVPTANNTPADAVLGQADFTGNAQFAPAPAYTPTARNVYEPGGVCFASTDDAAIVSGSMARVMRFVPIV